MPAELPQRNVPRPRRTIAETPTSPPRQEQPEEQSRFMSANEKHLLILEHASRRRTIDPMQRMALWVGVLVCAVVISGGWAYAVRQSIANAVQSPLDQTLEDFGYGSSADSSAAKQFKGNMQEAMKRVVDMEEKSVAEMRTAAAVGQQVLQAASSSSAAPDAAFPIPPGVKKD